MNIKPHLTVAVLLAAGLFATGCSQQQVAQPAQQAAPEPAPAPAPRGGGGGGGNCHTHPPIPGCTDSIRHCHANPNGPNHTHKYSCKGGRRGGSAPGPVIMVPKVKAKGNYKGPVMMDESSRDAMQQYQQN